MNRERRNVASTSKSLTQVPPQENRRKRNQRTALSQDSSRTSLEDLDLGEPSTQRSQKAGRASSQFSQISSQEEIQLAGKLIRYLLTQDRSKKVISRPRIVKDVLDNNGLYFHRVMNKAKHLLSEIFGYKLLSLDNTKYILINEVTNELPHINPSGVEGAKQVLLFLVLTHIFMQEDACTEASLWDFLTRLGIHSADNARHDYFGNIDHLINKEFVVQKYLEKVDVERSDPPKIEFKWGPRAEHEFSRRSALEFVSKVYGSRSMNSWTLQFKSMTNKERLAAS